MLALAPEALADVDPGEMPGFRRFVRRNPLGVVLTIAPWNYPYLTAVNSVVPALAAGATAHVDAARFEADALGTPYLAPQVLTDVDHGMRVMTEETFGPLVGVMPVACPGWATSGSPVPSPIICVWRFPESPPARGCPCPAQASPRSATSW